MKNLLEAVKKGMVTLLVVSCFYSCRTPEDRVERKEPPATATAHIVVIQQMKFTPAELTVSEGDTVTWINRDIVEHNVTEETNKEWSSSNLPPGKSWKMVVSKSASYMCTIHPVMKGKLMLKE